MGRIVLVGRLWLERERIGPERGKEHAVQGQYQDGVSRMFARVWLSGCAGMRACRVGFGVG